MTNEEALLIDIKFQLDMYGSGQGSAEDTLTRVREIIFSPSLTDDQQVVLEWLKEETQRRGNIHAALYWFYETNVELDLIPSSLSDVEWCQVLAAFAEWGMDEVDE